MPRTRSLGWSELKIGLMTLAAIAIAAAVIFLLSGSGGFFWQRYALRAKFTNVAGLKTGAPVRVSGVEVGSVKNIAFNGVEVEVRFELSKEMQPHITDHSTAMIGSVSLLGEGSLDLTAAVAGTPIPAEGYVRTVRTPGQLTDVTEQANQGLVQATELLKDIRAGKGTLGKLVTDEALYNEVTKFVDAANAVATNLRNGRGTLGKLANDPTAANALAASLMNVQRMTDQINAGQGSLGKLVNDDAFANSLNKATASIQEITAKLNRGEGTAGKLMNDQALYNKLDAVTGRFDELLTKLNAGEGTAGQLLKDKQLYENMNGTVAELRTLLTAIQKDPKKYLNVRISVF